MRGGVGYFTGRPPYVWLSNAFVGTGLEQVELTCTVGSVVPAFTVGPGRPAHRLRRRRGGHGGPAVALVLRGRLQVPADVPHLPRRRPPAARAVVGTVDFLYSKNVNQLYIKDANLLRGQNAEGRSMYGTIGDEQHRSLVATPSRLTPSSGPEGSAPPCCTATPRWAGPTPARSSSRRASPAGSNSTWATPTPNSKDAISLTSSQAFSNFQFAAVDGPLTTGTSRSFFHVPHKVTLSGTVNLPYRTTLSVIYIGRSGDPYSWIVNGDANADGVNGNDLPFIPADASQITLADPTQFAALDDFIESQDCLRETGADSWSATAARIRGRTT